MGLGTPKQYLPLFNMSVIEASLSCFFRHAQVAAAVVALHAEDHHWSQLNLPSNKKVYTVVGGRTRTISVSNALSKVVEMAVMDDFVLVHDAARPCLHHADLDLLIQKLRHDAVGGILATPVSDTIKQAKPQGEYITVDKTIDRAGVWVALTPQMFRIKVLQRALGYCFNNNIEITDEASAVETIGLDVKLIEGRGDNIKITRPADIPLAESILQLHSNQ